MPIFDQGYQHWKGSLTAYSWRWMAITRQGLRGQFKNWIVRILLLLGWLPAIALVTVLALWGMFEQGAETIITLIKPILPPSIAADPHTYRQAIWTISYSTFFKVELFFIMLLVVMIGPNLISRDLRFNALPLYLSRPLTRLDYFLGKLGVIAALVAAVAVIPAVAAYILGICFSLDLGVIRDTWRLLPASVIYGLIIVLSAGTLMLALSSLSRRSLYVGIAWVGIWVISSTVSTVLYSIQWQTFYQTFSQEEMTKNTNDPLNNQYYDPDDPSTHRRPGGGNFQRIISRVEKAEAEAAPTNWRSLCSYTANIQRLGESLLNTDTAWVTIGQAIEAPRAALNPLFKPKGSVAHNDSINTRTLADRLVPQYPWFWSAGVLLCLMGLSIWILSTRVKSLDRLK